MSVLYFMGIKPQLQLKDGAYYSGDSGRCNCLSRANMRCTVQNGQIIDVSCPVCGQVGLVEVVNGEISFFPVGIVVI